MYDEAGLVEPSLIASLLENVQHATWTHYNDGDKDYWTSFPKKTCPELPFTEYRDMFYLKLKPGGKVHRHTDQLKGYVTYHIPIQTNPDAVCFSFEDEVVAKHLEVGKQYIAHRQHPHWSTNDGNTDRIHLLVPVYKE